MAKKTVHAPGGPKKVFGMENTAHTGAEAANPSSVNGDVRSAISDFVQEEDHGQIDLSDAGYDTPIGDIDFSGYTQDEPFEEYGNISDGAAITRIYVDEDENLVYEEDWEDNPSSSITECLGVDNDDRETVESALPEEAFTIYDEEMTKHLSTDRVSVDVDSLERDYQRWTVSTTRDLDEEGDDTMGSIWTDMATTGNTFSYRIPDDVRESVSDRIMSETDYPHTSEAVLGLRDAGYEDLDPDDVRTFVNDAKEIGHQEPDEVRVFAENFITGGHSDLDQIDNEVESFVRDNYGEPSSLGIPVDESSEKSVGTQIREHYQNKPEIVTSDPLEISVSEDRYYVHRVF